MESVSSIHSSSQTALPYIISSLTMLLEPYTDEDQTKKTKVYEKDNEPFIADHPPREIIEHSCLYYFSTYEGRKISTKALTNIRHKPPIVIDPVTGVYFFSTHSDTNLQNRWISLQHFRGCEAYEKESTMVTFSGGREVILPISKQSFHQQYLKSASLYSISQFNYNEIREKNEPSYSLESQAKRLMFIEYFNRLEREEK